jgi:hypothetical protein
MSNTLACAFSTLAAVAGLALPAGAQSVISTHSGEALAKVDQLIAIKQNSQILFGKRAPWE